MTLIIGGAGAGKLNYIKSLGYSDKQISNDPQDDKPVLYGLETIIFDADHSGQGSSFPSDVLLSALLKKQIVSCDEVGSGIIPARRNERLAREACGRLCVLLAQRAERVVRIVAGIPLVLKSEVPRPHKDA